MPWCHVFKSLLEFLQSHKDKKTYHGKLSWLQSSWLEGADFVGKLENIKEDFAEVCSRIGISGAELPHLHKGFPENRDAAYCDKSIEIVKGLHAPDIERYDYEF